MSIPDDKSRRFFDAVFDCEGYTETYTEYKGDRYGFFTDDGSVGFMGFPIVSALYGPDAVFLAAICIIPFFLSTYSIGIVMVKGGMNGEKLGWKFLLNPALISTFYPVPLPTFCTPTGTSSPLI